MIKNPTVIKVGFCVAYDWVLLKKSLPRVYNHADKICLAIDKRRRSWSGLEYSFDEEAFASWIHEIDKENKIDLYEDDFALPSLSAMQNDNRQRTLIAQRMGPGGWHVQIDSDEYFLDFFGFTEQLRRIFKNPTGNEKPLNVCAGWLPLIKKVPGGYLFVDFSNGLPEMAPFATNRPSYERARHNGHFNHLTNHVVLHETWARSDDELWQKINSWGHSDEELAGQKKKLSYYNLWKALDRNNYQYVQDFHPAVPETWPKLGFLKGETIDEIIANRVTTMGSIRPVDLFLRNNRNIARIKALLSQTGI